MTNERRVFCQACGDALQLWSSELPYELWLESPCSGCGTTPSESRYQDSEIFLRQPMAEPLGAVALGFEQLATSLRSCIFVLCFDGLQGKGEICDAMLSPLSYSEQVRVFSAVFSARFPDRDTELKRFRRRLEDAGEARNRMLHSWWLPGADVFEAGMRVNTRISGGKLRKDFEDVSVRELTHLAAYFNRLQSDVLGFTLEAMNMIPRP